MTKAQSAQLKLEHYYKVAVDSAIERNTRYGSMYPTYDATLSYILSLKACRAGKTFAVRESNVRRAQESSAATTWEKGVDVPSHEADKAWTRRLPHRQSHWKGCLRRGMILAYSC